MTGRRDWSTLPDDAISTISTHLSDDADHVRFRSVCSSFRSAAPHRPLLPWLLVDYRAALDHCWVDPAGNLIPFEDLTEEDPPDDGADMFGGFRLCRFPNADFSPTHCLPDGTTAVAGCRNWIALLSDSSPGITLYNPFADIPIDLPALTNPRLRRIVLSSDPRARAPSAPCSVVALSGYRRLAYCHPGDASWTVMSGISDGEVDDIVFYEGRLFVVQKYKLFICDVGSGCTNASEVLPADPVFSDGDALSGVYLVESSGDLLLVSVRNPPSECDWGTFELEVFRVDLVDGRFSLTKLDNLGGRSLFLSCKSVSVSASNMPWCKGDCIYFIPDIDLFKFGVHVFSVKDGNVTEFHGLSGERVTYWDMLWLTPSLC